jgi:hypothetical protein
VNKKVKEAYLKLYEVLAALVLLCRAEAEYWTLSRQEIRMETADMRS